MKINELFSVQGYGVIVTGGASGIGLACVEALAENGAQVTILDMDGDRIQSEIDRLTALGMSVRGEVVDVRDHAALDKAFDAAAAAHGRLDVVFANAGIDPGPGFLVGRPGNPRARHKEFNFENYRDERWNKVMDVNLNGVFASLRAGARLMRPQRSGRLIITTSIVAYRCEPTIGAAYMAAKAGAAHLMRALALELAADQITVNAIAPGLFATNFGTGYTLQDYVQQAMSAVIPMHRVGVGKDLKGLALFLASPASSYVTGQQIAVDGGTSLGVAD